MDFVEFLNLECVGLKNNSLELLITRGVGPRLIRLSLRHGQNLLAELPGLSLDCPGVGPLRLWGGHRLWHAPEARRRTYLPDNQPVDITEIENGCEVVQPLESDTGIQKSMRITLPDQSPTVVIDHTLKNEGLWPVELAPWAITQLKPGGVAILPQVTTSAEPDGVLPNRHVALWPYTDVNSPHLQWGNHLIFVEANMREGALKIGFPNPSGWLAYIIDQTLFVKHALYQPEADYYDFGSSSECYCCPEFLELETLAPRTNLVPGRSVTHREIWRIYANIRPALTENAVLELVEDLGLSLAE